MYALLRFSHTLLAWLLVVLTAAPLLLNGQLVRRDRRLLRFALVLTALGQFAAGLLLHLQYSAYTAGVRANVDVVLHDPTLRYWNVVHPVLGLLAVGSGWWLASALGRSAAVRVRAAAALAFVLGAMSAWFQ